MKVRWVQVINGNPVQEFTDEELEREIVLNILDNGHGTDFLSTIHQTVEEQE